MCSYEADVSLAEPLPPAGLRLRATSVDFPAIPLTGGLHLTCREQLLPYTCPVGMEMVIFPKISYRTPCLYIPMADLRECECGALRGG